MRRARSSWNGTSIAKIAPVAGALKIAAMPAAAPATSSRLGSAPTEQRAPAPLHGRADRRAHVDRRAFEPHRATAAQRRDRGDHPVQHVADLEVAVRVERVQVLVGRLGERPPPGIAQPQRRDRETDAGGERHEPQRQCATHAVEHDVDGQAVESGDRALR